MITEFNSKTAVQFRDSLKSELESIGNRFGVEFKIEGMKLPNMQTLNISMSAHVGEVELKNTPSGRAFLSYAPHSGFSEVDLGKTFMDRGTLYRITGWKPTARKYSVYAERVIDGQVILFTPSYARSLLR